MKVWIEIPVIQMDFDSEYGLESISSNKMTEIFNLWNDSNQLPSIDKSPSLPDKQQTITNNY